MPTQNSNLMPSLPTAGFDGFRMPQLPDPTLPTIRKTKSYDVTFRRAKLQHKLSMHLNPLYAAFPSWESARSFSFEYTIHAGNMMDASSGKLSVVIQKV